MREFGISAADVIGGDERVRVFNDCILNDNYITTAPIIHSAAVIVCTLDKIY